MSDLEQHADGTPMQSHDDDLGDSSVQCVKCEETTRLSDTLSAGRSGRICKLCYNSAKALGNHFKKRGKSDEWQKMPPAKKKKMIIENKLTGGIRGKQRAIRISEQAWLNCLFKSKYSAAVFHHYRFLFFTCPQVSVSDSLSMQGEIYHTNKIEFL